MTQSLRVEGWKELAEVLGVFRTTMEQEASVPSVELRTTASGIVQLSVKIYNKDSPYQAAKDCQVIFDELRSKYL